MSVGSTPGLELQRLGQLARAGRTGQLLQKLEAAQKHDSPQAQAKKVARALEGLVVRQLVTVMRKTVGKSAVFGNSAGSEIFNDMLSGAIADQINAAGGLGLSRQLQATLTENKAWAKAGVSELGLAGTALPIVQPQNASAAPGVASSSSGSDEVQKPAGAGASKAVQPATVLQHARGLSVLKATADQGRSFGSIAFEAPNRRRAQPLRDADGQLAIPIRGPTSLDIDSAGRVADSAGKSAVAAFSGRVVGVSRSRLVLERADGTRFVYAGLDPQAQVGDLVLRGQALGTVSDAGLTLAATDRRGLMKASEIKQLISGTKKTKGQ